MIVKMYKIVRTIYQQSEKTSSLIFYMLYLYHFFHKVTLSLIQQLTYYIKHFHFPMVLNTK